MTNKPMLSVERELLERAASAIEKHHGSLQWVIASDLRAIIDNPVNFLTPDCPDCACVQDGQCLCIPSKPADHPQCEECKGWGYHENHHEGGGTECGECGGSGNATVAVVMPDNLVSHRNSWLQAMERLVALEAEATPATHDSDEAGYWEHELKAMRAMYADLDRLNGVKP